LQLQNNMTEQGVTLTKARATFSIAGANRYRALVPTRNNFPAQCKAFRKATIFVSTRLDPNGTGQQGVSVSGAPNVAFVQLQPLVSSDLIYCLRGAYGTLPATVLTSLQLVARVTALGQADNGKNFTTNQVSYNLILRHTCGNGRVDDGEQCDGTATVTGCPPTTGSPLVTCAAAGALDECTCVP